MKKISVIIPMYNAEKTIKECLDSLVRQTIFKDMELIIVDDCSTDQSPAIVMNYEERYPDNTIIINLDKNGGPGNARNVAMEYASGEYIGFVDSDDAVYPTMYEKMYNEAVCTDSDFVDSGFFDQKNDKAIVFVSDELAGELNDKKRSSLIVVGGYICTKIFKKDFIDRYQIRFRNEYVLEDVDYLIECIARAQRIGTVKEMMYVYRDSESSLSKTTELLKYIHNQSSAMKAIFDRTHLLPNYEGIKSAVEFMMLFLYSNILNSCTNAIYFNRLDRDSVIQIMYSIRKLKNAVVTGGYDSDYINKGLKAVDIEVIRLNDESPETVLARLKKSE